MPSPGFEGQKGQVQQPRGTEGRRWKTAGSSGALRPRYPARPVSGAGPRVWRPRGAGCGLPAAEGSRRAPPRPPARPQSPPPTRHSARLRGLHALARRSRGRAVCLLQAGRAKQGRRDCGAACPRPPGQVALLPHSAAQGGSRLGCPRPRLLLRSAGGDRLALGAQQPRPPPAPSSGQQQQQPPPPPQRQQETARGAAAASAAGLRGAREPAPARRRGAMADGGEGEDEIQFLRTVSAARLGFPGEQGEPGHPPTGSGQWDTRAGRRLPPGMREEPGTPQGAQVCVLGRGKGGCVSVRACVKPGDRARPERGERAGGKRAGSRGASELRESGDAGAAGRACPVGGAGIFRAARGRCRPGGPWGAGAGGDAGSRPEFRRGAVSRA